MKLEKSSEPTKKLSVKFVNRLKVKFKYYDFEITKFKEVYIPESRLTGALNDVLGGRKLVICAIEERFL
ncbi:uncharacterized protein ASCRUDRAFT_75830 [Ascoidea rubescens DSM 1968]|uniref:Uncharacterized protein n=1 Tax=Ascoidea rubescens DSM 1968 TaxID=1344418 RepID=A0A1D2VHN4_9ASCO|nr:hypothetical protein ASCRUDRAFT_75830 [Ascoidea rubescens DSM 1968]ODV61102.1 hypothetical protein ASCRUDRAFT_75830 [Ascoidea rubescens DSM 1968]